MTFTKGVLTGAIPWDLLEKQYASRNAYKDEVVRLIEFEESAHRAGVDFAQTMDRLAQLNQSNMPIKAEIHQPSMKVIQDKMIERSVDPFRKGKPNLNMALKALQGLSSLPKSFTSKL